MTAERILSHFDALDEALVAAGFPATSAWWRATLDRFYKSGRRQCVLRVGRRGGKSSTLCRVGVVEALYGEHHITPGDVGIVGVVSVDRREASARLRTIRTILDTLAVSYRERDGEIELVDRPIVFRVFTGSVAGVVGGTWVCAILDEVARWKDSETGANPAHEVLASLRPTMATQPNARMFLSSSPLGLLDAHARAYEQGDTAHQLIAHATTWNANPTITEAQTRADEPNERIWRREYECVPQGNDTSVFALSDIDAAMSRKVPEAYDAKFPRIAIADIARSGDDTVLAFAHMVWPSDGEIDEATEIVNPTLGWNGLPLEVIHRPVRHRAVTWNDERGDFDRVTEVQGADGEWRVVADAKKPKPLLVVDSIEAIPKHYDTEQKIIFIGERSREWRRRDGDHVTELFADQYEAGSMKGWARRVGLRFHEMTWTQSTKSRAVDRVERWLRDGTIALPKDDTLRKQLSEYSERVTRSGSLTYSGRGAHDDFAQTIVTLAMVAIEGHLPGDVDRGSNQRHEVY